MLRLVKRWGARLPALVAVGTLGVVAPAGAQSPSCPTQPCGRTAARTIVAEGPSVARVCEVPERFQEIRVELAWLANGATFPWPLSAHADRARLEVRGEVPDEAVRQEAVRLARLSTSLAVVDALHLRPEMRPARPPSGVGGDVMVHGVMGVLREVLGDRAVRVKMGMRAGGQVTLRGVVSSCEEKLAISARIRRVPGCVCVVNELTVPPTMHDGRAVLPVSADGSKVVSVLPASADGSTVVSPLPVRAEGAKVVSPLPVRAEGAKVVAPLPAPIQSSDAPYRAATWSAPAVAQPQPAASRPKEMKPSRPAAPRMPPATDTGGAVRPLPLLPAIAPAVAPAPVVPAAKPPVMPKATSTPLPKPTVQPVAHFDAPLGAPAESSRPSLPEPAKASHGPARNGAGFAQDRTASTAQEARPTIAVMSPPQCDLPELRWPVVVHDEALPLPGKHPTAGPDATGAPMSPVAQAPRSLPSGAASETQQSQKSQPIRPSAAGKVPEGPAMPHALPAPPVAKPTIVFEEMRTPPPPKGQPQEKPKPAPVLPPVSPPTASPAVSGERSGQDKGVTRPGLFSIFQRKREERPSGVTEKVSPISAQAMPMRPAQPVIQPPKPAIPDKPYVSTALVTFEDEPAAPPVKLAKMAAPSSPMGVAMSPVELQQRVLRVCAGSTRDVQVMMRADRHWEVKVKVPTAALAKEVSEKVLQLPDMAQPHVHLMLEITE